MSRRFERGGLDYTEAVDSAMVGFAATLTEQTNVEVLCESQRIGVWDFTGRMPLYVHRRVKLDPVELKRAPDAQAFLQTVVRETVMPFEEQLQAAAVAARRVWEEKLGG